MAVNINTVYETVLTILNKEQRGYLDQTEFNNLARQVQREIVEGYFLKEWAAGTGNTDFSDLDKSIEEKISYFEATANLTERSDNISFFEYPSDFYRLGVVINQANGVIVDEISHLESTYIRRSPLTAPTERQPVFTRENGGIKCYPDTDTSSVNNITMVYIKTPTDPFWGFNQAEFDNTGDLVYDSNVSTDFELHPSEEHELVIRILAYAGVVVRDPAVTGFAQQAEGRIQATEE